MSTVQREPFGQVEETFGQEPKESVATDGIPKMPVKPSKKLDVHYCVPKSVAWRIGRIIEAERRNKSVVMEKVVSDFLSVNGQRSEPYYPECLHSEDTVKLAWKMPSSQKESLDARFVTSCIEVRYQIIRALMDYIDASPDDPMKHIPVASAEPVVEDAPGDTAEDPNEPISEEDVGASDYPDSEMEEPIPEDEGIEGFEEASE